MNEIEIGVGLYVSFNGWYVKLRAPRDYPENVIFFDPTTLAAFERFIAALKEKAAAADG